MSNQLKCIGVADLKTTEIHSGSTGHLRFNDDKENPLLFVAWGKSLQIFSLYDAPVMRRISTLHMEYNITGIVIKDNLVFLNCWTRGISIIDISCPEQPRLIECMPFIGRGSGALLQIDNYLIVSWEREKLLGLYDISDEKAPDLKFELVLDESIEDMKSYKSDIYIANDAGVAVVNIVDDRLIVSTQYLQDIAFQPRLISIGERGIYIQGYGDDDDFIVLDKNEPTRIIARKKYDLSDASLMLDSKTSSYLFHSHYSCSELNHEWTCKLFFKQYFADSNKRYIEVGNSDELKEHCTCLDEPQAGIMIDQRLITIQENQIMLWEFPESSLLRNTTVAY